MGLQAVIAACALLSLCLADQTMRTVNSMLDPNRLTWWRTKWAPSPIQLSANNANQAGVTATFYFCPSTSIASGVVEITFPSSAFTLPATAGLQAVSGQVVSVAGVALVAGQDTKVTVTGIKNPAQEGAFGPFALRTRLSINGQQMDVNLTFGAIFIRAAVTAISGATVSVVGAASTGTVINKPSNTLSFKFTISQSLWRFDLFVITIDSRWTINSGATCSSADYTGKWNNFNGTTTTGATNPHALQCYINAKSATVTTQTAYIYGLAVDGIDTTVDENKFVDLRITSAVSPNAQYSGHPYTWTITTCRFGTSTLLEQATIASGPTVNTDVPGAVTWGATWGSVVGDLYTGLSYFMDLSITLTNPVPQDANSYVEIQVTETIAALNGGENWLASGATNCYLVTFLTRSTTCEISGTGTIRIANLPALTASTTIKVRNLVSITTASGKTARVNSVKSYLNSNAAIDASSSTTLGTITIASSSAVVNTFAVYTVEAGSTTSAALTGGNGANTQTIQFVVIGNPQNQFTTSSDTVFAIGCAFASALDDFSFGIPISTVDFAYLDSATTAAVAMAPSAVSSNKPSFSLGTNGGHGTLSFTGAVGAAIANGVHLSLNQASTVTTAYITLPRVATNIATAYECRLSVTIKSQATQRGTARFKVSPQVFSTKTATFTCLDRIDGVPVIIELTPKVHKINDSSSNMIYYVEFQFTSGTAGNYLMSDSATGLVIPAVLSGSDNALDTAVSYPFSKSGITGSPVATIYRSGSISQIAVTGAGEILSSASGTKFIMPIGGAANTATVTPSFRSYYISVKDPRYKFITHEDSATQQTFVAPSAGSTWSVAGTPAIIGTSGTTVNWEINTAGVTINAADSDCAEVANHYYYVVLPMGYRWSTGTAKRVSGTVITNFPTVWTFSVPNWGFKYPGMLFSSGSATPYVALSGTDDSAKGTLNIGGYQVRPGSSTTNQSMQVVFGAGGNGACKAAGAVTLISNEGAITEMSVSNLAIKTKGPDGINISHTVTFTLAHGIPAGGRLVFTLHSSWSTTSCSSCSVTGLPGTPSCSLSGGVNTAVVTGHTEFTASVKGVTLTVSGLLPPATAGSYSFVGSAVSQAVDLSNSAQFYVIDRAADAELQKTPVVVTNSGEVGKTKWADTKKVIPSTISATVVDLHLKFSLTHALYKTCGTITLTSPYPFKSTTADCKNYVFSSLVYSACSWTGSTLTLTLDQDYQAGTNIELYVDAAVDNPSTTTPSSTGFSISTFWASQQVDLDSTTSALVYSATIQPSATLTPATTAGLTFSPKTACEVATYTFTFKDTAAFTTSDQYWIVFPRQFDYFLGDVWQWFSVDPDTYYIDCACIQLGTTWCTVDHGIVVVSGSSAVASGVDVTITISGVVNPAVLTDSFQVYHVDSKSEIKSIQQSFGTVSPAAMAGDLGVRSLDQTDRRLFKPSDYKWRLYITDVLLAESQLKVQFPREFDLGKFDSKDSYSCFTTYQDISTAATDRSQKSWNTASACATSGNWVTLPGPTSQTTFTSTNIVTWTLQSVRNPQWGLSRTQLTPSSDFDVYDATLWPLDPLWASRFNFFVYQSGTANQKYSTRSYQNTNAAYAGFTRGYRQVLVNGFDPLKKTGRIVVRAGIQTKDVFITTESTGLPMAAKKVMFTPKSNTRTSDSGKLKYTSVIDNWTLFQGYYSMRFRVAAAFDMAKGLYYIDWANEETIQSGLSEVQYDTPASTLVEVVPLVTGYSTLSVTPIPDINLGFSSVPIKITAAYCPHTDVTVTIAVSGSPANISVSPTTITFLPDVDSQYFQIQVASNYDLSTLGASQSLSFTLSGTDKDAFTIASSLKFTIVQPSTTEPVTRGTIKTFGLAPATKTSVSFSPTTDKFGIIYYQLAAKGSTVPSYSELKASVVSLVGQNATNSSPAAGTGTNSESDPADNESWKEFQWRLYKAHVKASWSGAIAMQVLSGVEAVLVNWLWAGTNYQIAGYLDDLSAATTDPTVLVETFSTAASADYQPVTFKYEGAVQSSYLSKIAETYAGIIGVNPLRLDGGVFTPSTARLLQMTTSTYSTFSYNLLPNRFLELPTPLEQAKLSTAQIARLQSELKTAGIDNTWSGFTTPSPQAKIAPIWVTSPASGGSDTSSVSVVLRASVLGQSCCIAVTSSEHAPSSEQVMLGLDAQNAEAPARCVDTDLTQSTNAIQIDGLQPATTYYAFCTAVDSYPLWPEHMSFSATSPIQPVSITTQQVDIVADSSARYFGGLFLLAALLH